MNLRQRTRINCFLVVLIGAFTVPGIALAQDIPHFQVIVNSNQDGAIAADELLTLREAIALVNGTLPLNQLSAAETEQVKLLNNQPSTIEFNLPAGKTVIQLTDILPPLASPGLTVDGTTQPGYNPKSDNNLLTQQIPVPVVTITPAKQVEIFRGLTVVADGVNIRGLSLYGFTAKHGSTAVTPPADIFIADPQTAAETSTQSTQYQSLSKVAPKDVVIENNWLGMPLPLTDVPAGITLVVENPSAFGVYIFNSLGTTIKNNLITLHQGSGIITGQQASNLKIIDNDIQRNGFAGMPDAIRLEGIINNSEISSNTIKENSGSAIYAFKPEGSVKISDNKITDNGKRLRRAAIYLMGNNHSVTNNQISNQPGSGVVVAAYPQSRNIKIQTNFFDNLEGLAIDLVSQLNVSPQDYQQGDGANPLTDSYQRQRKTGNFGIDAPRFLSNEFFIVNPQVGVTIDGVAEPNSQVEIYLSSKDAGTRELVGKPITTVNVNDKGRFCVTLGTLKPGDRVSAIATHPQYGTSEPAVNAVIRSID